MLRHNVKTYLPAGPTLAAFHASDAFVRVVRGPIGSGKSTACCAEILKRAHEQQPGPDGRRRTRWAIIRQTQPELRTTSIKTWHQWLPDTIGRFTWDSPPSHRLVTRDLDLEMLFLALERDDDVRKLFSLELTAAFVNEAREVPKAIVDTLTGRVGRFPPMAEGGATWSGIVMDTMAPDSDHWLYRAAEEDTPDGWEFFAQPAGDGPDAENTHNLPKKYYDRAAAGKDADWITVYIRGEYGFAREGKPVWSEYRDAVHCAGADLKPIAGLPIWLGLDFGLTPAAVIAQRDARGRWFVLDELIATDMGIVRFSEMLANKLAEDYPEIEDFAAWADPAGMARAETDERTAIGIAAEYLGFDVSAAPTNDFAMRREAVAVALSRLIDGEMGFQISPRCRTLRKALSGGYCFRRVQVNGPERHEDRPLKNHYSHVGDALQYLLSGAGEASIVMRSVERHHGGRYDLAAEPEVESEYDEHAW